MSSKNHEESGYGLKNGIANHLARTNRVSPIQGEVAILIIPISMLLFKVAQML